MHDKETPGAVEAEIRALNKAASFARPSDDEDKSFRGLQAKFALHGHQLHRSNSADGPVTFYATRSRLVRHLPALADARVFLNIVGGYA